LVHFGAKKWPQITASRNNHRNDKQLFLLLFIAIVCYHLLHYAVPDQANGVAMDKRVEVGARVHVLKELCQYVAPKRTAVEVTGEKGGPLVLEIHWPNKKSKYLALPAPYSDSSMTTAPTLPFMSVIAAS
jgi:hypothetical protein